MTAMLLVAAWSVVVLAGIGLEMRRPERVAELLNAVAPRQFTLTQRARTAIAFLIPLPVVPTPLNLGVGALAASAMWRLPAWERRREERRRLDRFAAEMPEVVDLLVLAVGAGLTVPLALDAVARRGTGALPRELERALVASRQGHRLADALDELPARCGESVRPLTAALVAAERYGAPLVEGLERLAAEVRSARRRRADEAARKVSVKLLFPLVLCILPAFALLTVAPLIASALRSLRL